MWILISIWFCYSDMSPPSEKGHSKASMHLPIASSKLIICYFPLAEGARESRSCSRLISFMIAFLLRCLYSCKLLWRSSFLNLYMHWPIETNIMNCRQRKGVALKGRSSINCGEFCELVL